MNTAEETARQITRAMTRSASLNYCVSPAVGGFLDLPNVQGPSLSTLQRIDVVLPWVSESSGVELLRVRDDVAALLKANRYLATALADAHEEINRLRGGHSRAAA